IEEAELKSKVKHKASHERSCDNFSKSFSFRLAKMREKPSLASRRAIPSPMPRLAPVISAHFIRSGVLQSFAKKTRSAADLPITGHADHEFWLEGLLGECSAAFRLGWLPSRIAGSYFMPLSFSRKLGIFY